MANTTPLEKQVINIDLSKGLDQRMRPELIPVTTGITGLENLVQDQTGAWVKRPGTTVGYQSDASGTSTYPVGAKRVFQLVNGWACFADYGRMYVKQDQTSTLRARQYQMDLSALKSAFVASSGPVAISSTSAANIQTTASCGTHDAVVVMSQINSSRLTISERATGVEYVYDLSKVTIPAPGLQGGQACACFVGDRFLQVYVAGLASRTLSVIVIDVQAAMPVNEAALVATNVTTVGAGSINMWDCVGGTTYGYILFDNTANPAMLYQVDSTGATADFKSFAGIRYMSMDVDETTGYLWLMAKGATTAFVAQAVTAVSVTNVAPYTSTNPGTYISCNPLNGTQLIYYDTTFTFGGTTINGFTVLTQAAGAGATVVVGSAYGWQVVSRPFFMSSAATAGKFYAHLSKNDTLNDLSSHAVCDLSTFTQFSSNNAGLPSPFGSFRIACSLEPFNGLRNTGNGAPGVGFRYKSYDGYDVSACVTFQTAQRAAGIAFTRLRLFDASAYGVAQFSGETHVAHGGLNCYDQKNLFDQGFCDMPVINIVTPVATAGNLAGSYRYVCVYRHVDSNGASAYSRTYGPVASTNVAASTGRNNMTVQPWGITNRDAGNGDSLPVVELYRTKSGGTQYYLCATSQLNTSLSSSPLVQQLAFNATTGLLTVQDNLSDAILGAQAGMYRQPGTTNGAADRYAGPACKFVIQHKDRLFCTDPYGQRVYYSSFFVDGESAWFSPTFNFFVHAGAGPITGLASMDGRLFIFKRDAVFVVDGDGPGESGPTGNEFSPPQSLAARFGCIDHRSIVVTPDGIMYRSSRGFELLTRNLQVKWIGERVWVTAGQYPVCVGSCVDSSSRVHFLLAEAGASDPAPVYYVNGAEVVYDMSNDTWTTSRYWGYGFSVYGSYKLGCAVVNDGGTEKVAFCDSYQTINLTSSNGFDLSDTKYVPWSIELGWVKQGPQTRQRISDVMFLGKSRDVHAIKISLAYDYSDSYTQTHTWQPVDLVGLPIEELDIHPVKPETLSIRVKIEDSEPSDTVTYPTTTGRGAEILAISAEVAAKTGAPKLSSGQKA